MQFNFNSIKDFFWYIIYLLYSLVPSVFFLFISFIIVSSFNNNLSTKPLPDFYKALTLFFTSLDNNFYKVSLFIITAFIFSLISEAINNVILWHADETKESKIDYIIDFGEEIKDKLRLTDFVGLKMIHEYVNLNSWTSFMLATKSLLLSIQNYINLLLLLFFSLTLYLKSNISLSIFIILIMFHFCLLSIALYCVRGYIRTLRKKVSQNRNSETPGWEDLIITESKDYLILGVIILLGFGCILVSVIMNSDYSLIKHILLISSSTLFYFPLQIFLVLTAQNFHNRVRKMVESAFYQIRFDDKIFRGAHNKLEKSSKNENSD